MRPGATKVETVGSFFFMDDDAGEYVRLPKNEGPRSSPPGEDWGGPNADPGLQDLVWHEQYGWEIKEVGVWERLIIYRDPDHKTCVHAPIRMTEPPSYFKGLLHDA